MLLAIIGIVLFLILVLMAVGIGLKKEEEGPDDTPNPMIHASGIYSIVRKSPREKILGIKPAEEEIRKYLSSQNEIILRMKLSSKDKEHFISQWNEAINKSISTVEQGDKDGVEFYFYEFIPDDCQICTQYLSRGKYVTREEIFRHPQILPPFHLGCTCSIQPHHGKENLRDTTELRMLPLFKEESLPPLPDWKSINSLHVLRGASA